MEKVQLLTHPEEYATRAIAAIQQQLNSAKSPKKIAKLTSRMQEWRKLLEVLEVNNGK